MVESSATKLSFDDRHTRLLFLCIALLIFGILVFYNSVIDDETSFDSHLIDIGCGLILCGTISCIAFIYLHKTDQPFRLVSGSLLCIGGVFYVVGGWREIHHIGAGYQYENEYQIWYSQNFPNHHINEYKFGQYWLFGLPCIFTGLDIILNSLNKPKHRILIFTIILTIGSFLIYSFWNDFNQDWLSDIEIILEWCWLLIALVSVIVVIISISVFVCTSINRMNVVANVASVLLIIGAIGVVFCRWYKSERVLFLFPKFDQWEYVALSLLVFVQCFIVATDLTTNK